MKTYCKNYVFTRQKVAEVLEEWKKGDSGRKNEHRIQEEYGSELSFIDVI